jgi:ABC-type antimicrobial peptide transport system permease subunit
MASYVEEGSLWKVGEFLVTNETVSNMRSVHYKTHFVIKLRNPDQAGELASALRTRLAENAMVITREEAVNIITKSSPKIATSLAFMQTNSTLITLVSFGGIAIATVTSIAARTQTFALLRTRGARRTSCIAFFAPEAAFVSLVGAVLGLLLGLALAVGFSASLTYFVAPLFTGNPFQMIIDQTVWFYVVLILAVSTITYAVAVFKLAKIGRGIG